MSTGARNTGARYPFGPAGRFVLREFPSGTCDLYDLADDMGYATHLDKASAFKHAAAVLLAEGYPQEVVDRVQSGELFDALSTASPHSPNSPNSPTEKP